MVLDFIIEEIEGGFHFRDSLVDIKVTSFGSRYEMRWENTIPGVVTNLPMASRNINSMYRDFRMAIDDHWSSPLDDAWRIVHEEKIEELFKQLKKYE